MGHRVAYHDPFLSGPLTELEGKAQWHGKLPNPGDFEAAILIQNHSGFADLLKDSRAEGTLLSTGISHGPFASLWGTGSSRGDSAPPQQPGLIDLPLLHA